jgi:hypothetical protein
LKFVYGDKVSLNCRAAFAACQRGVLTWDGPHPRPELGAVAVRWEHVVLTGRATHVP